VKDIIREFKTLDLREYTSVPFWSWNNQLCDEELIAQIHAMKDAGIMGFTMHARTGLKVPYLSEEWFHYIEVCLNEAAKLGMHALVYDENGWPSGFVGGKLLSDPENLAQYLRYEVKDSFDATAFGVYTVTDGVAQRIEAPSADANAYHCVYLKSSPANTDILNPRVMDQFINDTYEEYYRRFGDRFGKELLGFFTDEPQYYRYETPYTRVAAPVWAERYGSDIRDGLVYLFILSEAGYEFRTRYYSLMNELYTTNYYKRLFDWCTDHNCVFTGHSIEESSLNMQMWGGAACTPSYEYETWPGIDHLGRFPAARLSAKQIGSAAQQLGKKHVLTETYGCSGWDATPRELRCIGDAQYVRGVNLMCQHLSSYSLKGQGKLDHPPCFSRHMTWWSEYKQFNEYFDRLGYLVANSKDIVNAVVINPMASVYLDYLRLDEQYVADLDAKLIELQDALTDHCVSYHLADETVMAKYGKVENGKFCVGACSYNSVILPYCRSLSASTKALLQQFVAAGGHVYLFDGVPAYTGGISDDYSFLNETLADSFETIASAEALPIRSEGKIQFANRIGDGYHMVFVVNETDKDAFFTLPGGKFVKADLNALTVEKAESSYKLEAGKSMLFFKDYPCGLFGVRRARSYADGEIDITPEFRFENGNDNVTILDYVSISKNGVDFDEPHYIYEVFERLVKEDYQGELWVKYHFTVKNKPSRVKLLCEQNDQKWFKLNGTEIQPDQSAFDIFYQEAQIAGLLQEGDNDLVYQVKWWQDPNVRYALFDPEATESLRNCLAFDTEIEPVFLIGDFKLDGDRALITDDSAVRLQDIPGSGYKHFCGSKTFTARITAEKAHALLTLDGRYMVCGVKVNGISVGSSVLDNTVALTLNKGEENIVELTVTSSLRNMFGPHHMGCEPAGVSPICFTMRGGWENGENPDYHPDYNTVPFGLTGVTLRYEK